MRRAITRFAAIGMLALSAAGAVAATSDGEELSMPRMTSQQLLEPNQLTAEELEYYKTLTAPDQARAFIATRSYVMLCRRVNEHSLPAIQLPHKPVGFSAGYLLPGDPKIINKAMGASMTALMEKSLQARRTAPPGR